MDLRADQFSNYTPAALGLDDVDIQRTTSVAVNSNLLDWRNIRAVRIVLRMTETGTSTTGLVALKWRPTNSAGTALHTDIDIVTSFNAKTSGWGVIHISEGLAPDEVGTGTIGDIPSACIPWGFGYLRAVVEEQADGTTNTLDVYADVI
jgi:hypothetical protein